MDGWMDGWPLTFLPGSPSANLLPGEQRSVMGFLTWFSSSSSTDFCNEMDEKMVVNHHKKTFLRPVLP